MMKIYKRTFGLLNKLNILQKHVCLQVRKNNNFRNLFHAKPFDATRQCTSEVSHLSLRSTSNFWCLNRHSHSGPGRTGKLFAERENELAHSIMENKSEYSETLASRLEMETVNETEFQSLLSSSWTDLTPQQVVGNFKKVSFYCANSQRSMTDCAFDPVFKSLVETCKSVSDDELLMLLQCLCMWKQNVEVESINSHNFCEAWSSLDKECIARLKLWKRQKILLFADHWYSLKLGRVCDFVWYGIRKISRKTDKLSPSELVQTMFFVNICRRIDSNISMYDFEYSFERCINELTSNEMGIIAMGFFKSQTKIHSHTLLTLIMEKIIDDINIVHEITLCSLLKLFRYGMPINLTAMLYELLDKLVPQVERLSCHALAHAALAGVNSQVFHEALIRNIVHKYIENIHSVRLKELEKILFVMNSFNFDPKTEPCIFEIILQEMTRQEREVEITKHPKCFIECIQNLSFRRIFPSEQISRALDPDFIKLVYGSMYGIGREVLILDCNLEIDCPEYNGKRLDSDKRRHLAHKFCSFIPEEGKKHSVANRMLLECFQTSKELLREDGSVVMKHVLPQYERADIVFCLGQDQKPLKLPDEFLMQSNPSIKYPIINYGDWYCLVIGAYNAFIRDTTDPVGNLARKLRQLETIGFKPIVIPWFEWTRIPLNTRQDYLQEKLFGKSCLAKKIGA